MCLVAGKCTAAELGSFFGAWLGGRLYDSTGSYTVMWWLEVAAGVFAAAMHFPIDNARAGGVPRRRQSLDPVKLRQLTAVLDQTAAAKAVVAQQQQA